MKATRKLLSVLLVCMMVLGLSVTAFAAQTVTYTGTGATTDGKITVTNATLEANYSIYKIFDATVSANGDIAYKTDKSTADLNKTGLSWTEGEGASAVTQTNQTVNGADWFTIDAQGNVTQTPAQKTALEAAIGTPRFAAWVKAFAGTATASTPSGGATDSTVIFDKVPYGYYYLTSSVGALITVDSTTPEVEIKDKNATPPDWHDQGKTVEESDKVLKTGDAHTTAHGSAPADEHNDNCYEEVVSKVKANELYLDEETNFEIAIDAKRYDGEKKIFQYVIKDKMDNGMTYVTIPEVKVGSTKLETNRNVAGSSTVKEYTIKYFNKSGTEVTVSSAADLATVQSFEVNIPWTSTADKTGNFLYNDSVITITYRGKLDSTKVTDISFVDANNNKAGFDWYSDDDNPGTNPKDPLDPQGENPKSETHTYSTELNILKLDGETRDALKGAEFTLTGEKLEKAYVTNTATFTQDNTNGTYWLLKDGTYTTKDPATLKADAIANPGNYDTTIEDPTNPRYAYEYNRTKYESVTNKYTKTTTSEVITKSTTVTIKGTVADDGTLRFAGLAEGTYNLAETKTPAGYNTIAPINLTVTFDRTEEKFTLTGASNLDSTGKTLSIEVVNNKGVELPQTGGIGRTVFYVVGALLLVGAGVVLFTRRRVRYNAD